MKRVVRALLVPVLAAGVALSATGCIFRDPNAPHRPADSTGGPAATTAPAVATTPPAPTTPAAPPKLAATGLGPYTIGAKLAALKSAGLLDKLNESTGCPGWATAEAAGPYVGSVQIAFYNGAIAWVTLMTQDISTVEGAAIGMTPAQVKSIYGAKAVEVLDSEGHKALSVHASGGLGLFFRNDKEGRIGMIEAGPSETLEFRYTDGEGC